MAQPGDEQRQQREADGGEYDQRQVGLDPGNVAEPVTGQAQGENPEKGAGEIKGEIARIAHLGDAGDEGCEGTDEGHEARHQHGLAAMRLVIGMRDVEALAVEETRVLLAPGQDALAGPAPDPVVCIVAEDGGGEQHRDDDVDLECSAAGGGQGTGHEQQRIAGEEGGDDKARLAEDDDEEDDVDPGAVLRQQQGEVLVHMQDDVDELGEKFHWTAGDGLKAQFYRKAGVDHVPRCANA